MIKQYCTNCLNKVLYKVKMFSHVCPMCGEKAVVGSTIQEAYGIKKNIKRQAEEIEKYYDEQTKKLLS